MDEIWARAGIVGGALVIAGVVVAIQRLRARHPTRTIRATGVGPGVYLFSSATCSTCARARTRLETRLGEDGFHELTWEESPEVFGELGVDSVPAVMLVDDGGRGRLYPGQPERALQALEARLDP